jgi:hypothetical protein
MTTGIDIERLSDGLIVDEDGQVDMAGFLRQLEPVQPAPE